MVVNETHTFRGTWLMYAILMVELPTLILIVVLWQTGHLGDEGFVAVAVVAAVMTATFMLIINIKLELRVDDLGLAYRFSPFNFKWKKIPADQVQSIKVKKTDGLLEYGGIGYRVSRKQRAYIFMADHVIELELGDRKLVFSTSKPEMVKSIIADWQKNTN
jgi:hypothetical protein